MPVLTLSVAHAEDLDSVQDFVAREKSEYIISHSLQEQRRAAEQGLFFKVLGEYGDFAAVASVIQIEDTTNYEMANALVAPAWRGLGLQSELILARVATLVATYGSNQHLVTAVNPGNTASRHIVMKAGFLPCPQVMPDLFWGCGSCPSYRPGQPCCCDCYALPEMQKRQLVREFLDRGKSYRLPKSPSVTLRLDCAAATQARRRATLEAFTVGQA